MKLNPVVDSFTMFAYVLFFFISGFVLYLNHPSFHQLNELTDFFKKRVLRIFPLYWLVLAFWFVIGVLLASATVGRHNLMDVPQVQK